MATCTNWKLVVNLLCAMYVRHKELVEWLSCHMGLCCHDVLLQSTVDWEIFVCRKFRFKFSLSCIFIARAHRQKLNTPKINLRDNCRARVECKCDMRKRHTVLNVLVCCLTHVRKRTIHDGLEDHRRVSCTTADPSSLRHYVTVRQASIIQLCFQRQ